MPGGWIPRIDHVTVLSEGTHNIWNGYDVTSCQEARMGTEYVTKLLVLTGRDPEIRILNYDITYKGYSIYLSK